MTGSDHPRPSPLATALNRAVCGTPSRLPARALRRVAAALRKGWLRLADPAVTITWKGVGPLLVPLSHELAYIAARVPGYGQNLGRVAAALAQAHPGFTAVDIGANVGDSALLLRQHGAAAVLGVEGAPEFLPYLSANVAADTAIEIAPTFVAVATSGGVARIAERGSSHFQPAVTGDRAPGRSWAEILAQHPRFAAPRLVKLDTDGLDLEILHAMTGWLAAVRPVLFFEYLPWFFHPHGTDAAAVFGELAAAGYGPVLVYDNFGRFLSSLSVQNRDAAFFDVLGYFDRPDSEYYADLVVFARGDEALARQVADRERSRRQNQAGAIR